MLLLKIVKESVKRRIKREERLESGEMVKRIDLKRRSSFLFFFLFSLFSIINDNIVNGVFNTLISSFSDHLHKDFFPMINSVV